MGEVIDLRNRFPKKHVAVEVEGGGGLADSVAAWLYEHDYPYSWSTQEPPPFDVLYELAALYIGIVAETEEAVMESLYASGGWAKNPG